MADKRTAHAAEVDLEYEIAEFKRRHNLDERAETEATTRGRQVGGDHYTSKTIQPWDAMADWMPAEQFAGFLRGNAIKYLARADDKGGLQDVRKAQHYVDKLVEHMSDV